MEKQSTLKTVKEFLVKFIVFAVLILLNTFVSQAAQPPTFQVEFRGTVTIDGQPAQDGTEISIWANNGALLLDTKEIGYDIGYYHHLKIKWDDPTTFRDEGITYDDTTKEPIILKINDIVVPGSLTVTTTDSGKTINYDISLTKDQLSQLKFSPNLTPVLVIFIVLLLFILLMKYVRKKEEP